MHRAFLFHLGAEIFNLDKSKYGYKPHHPNPIKIQLSCDNWHLKNQ